MNGETKLTNMNVQENFYQRFEIYVQQLLCNQVNQLDNKQVIPEELGAVKN